MRHKALLLVLATLTVVGSLTASAWADTILYQDAFHRRIDNGNGTYSPKPLNGTTPDIGSGTWNASSSWNTLISTKDVGYASLNASTGNYSAWLPVTVAPGYVYTLSAQFQIYGGASFGDAGKYAALGFAYSGTTPSGTTSFYSAGTAYAVEKTGATTADCLDFALGTTSYSGYGNLSYTSYSQSQVDDRLINTIKVVLDTTGSAWTVSAYINNATTPYAAYTYGSGTSVNYVGLSATKDLTVMNFSLSQAAVPEPSTLVMLFAGAAGVFAYAWRKRR